MTQTGKKNQYNVKFLKGYGHSISVKDGKPVTFMNWMMDSLTSARYMMAQYDTFRDESKCEYLTKQIISVKKESHLKLLKLIGNDVST